MRRSPRGKAGASAAKGKGKGKANAEAAASGGGAKRLSVVPEDEVVEVAKLVTAEAEVADVAAKVADIENKMQELEGTHGASFSQLAPFMQGVHKDAGGYYAYLQSELTRLSTKEAALLNVQGGQLHVVAKVKRSKATVWKVKGRLVATKTMGGVRRMVYDCAIDTMGHLPGPYSDNVAVQKAARRESVYYEDNDLVFMFMFFTEEASSRFMTLLAEKASLAYIPRDRIKISAPTETAKEDWFPVTHIDYISGDEESPAYSERAISAATRAEFDDPLTKHQSIENLDIVLRFSLEKAHLKDNAVLRTIRGGGDTVNGRDDSSNNRLVLSHSLHKYFDGPTRGAPLICIEAVKEKALPDEVKTAFEGVPRTIVDSDNRQRTLVCLSITGHDDEALREITPLMKAGTCKHDKGLFSYVHVLDEKAFCRHLEWKCKNTTDQWNP